MGTTSMKVYKLRGYYYDSDWELNMLDEILFKSEASAQRYVVRLTQLAEKLEDFYIKRHNKVCLSESYYDKWCANNNYYENLEDRMRKWDIRSLSYIEVTVRD